MHNGRRSWADLRRRGWRRHETVLKGQAIAGIPAPVLAAAMPDAHASAPLVQSNQQSDVQPVASPKASGLLFRELAAQYLRHARAVMTPRTFITRHRLVVRQLAPAFGPRPMDAITSAEIQRFLDRLEDVTGATRNRYLTALSTLFRFAMDLDLVERNPCRRVRRCRETLFPMTLLDTADQDRLLDLLEEPLRTFFLLLLDTGLRLGEALELEWTEVDLVARTLYVRHSKAKRPRVVGVSRRLCTALATMRHQAHGGEPLVFPTACSTHYYVVHAWRVAFKAAAARIGRPRLRIHDLRHTHAVNLVRRCVDLPTVQTVLGHTTLVSTFRYAEYADNNAAMRVARALDVMHGRVPPRDRPSGVTAVEEPAGAPGPCSAGPQPPPRVREAALLGRP